jgi:hypothetical protein
MAKRIIQTHFCLAFVLIGGLVGCATNAPNHPSGLPLRYYNSQYDFTFFLPASWQGYSVLVQQWGPNQTDVMVAEEGPIIVLRHPLWKTNVLYQDIPIMVFTHKQWDEENQGRFFPYAGGIIGEMWHNRKYVFGLYSRYNAGDDVKVWKEADDIIATNCAAHNEPTLYPNP